MRSPWCYPPRTIFYPQSVATFERIPNAAEVYRLLREVQNRQIA